VLQSAQSFLLAGTIERKEKLRSWMREIVFDAVIARKRAKMIDAETSIAVRTVRNAEKSVERRMILLESLSMIVVISDARGVKTRLAKKGTKGVRDAERSPVMIKMRDVRSVGRNDAVIRQTIESKFVEPRAKQLCPQQLSILSSTRFQMMPSLLQKWNPK
jgi:hypothetical protein